MAVVTALPTVSLGPAATAQATGVKVLGWGFSSPTALAAAGPDLFVAEPAASTVLELGAQTGGLVRVLGGHFDGPVALAVVGPDLFVANEGDSSGFSLGGAGQGPVGSVDELDTATGSLVKVFSRTGFDQPDALIADGADLFVADAASNSVTELDLATHSVLRELSGPSYGFDHPDALALAGPHLFVASNGTGGTGGSLTEVDAATGAMVRQLSGAAFGFAGPRAMAVSGDDLFVANEGFGSGSVTEVSIPTGAVLRSIPGAGGSPADLLVDGDRLFVAGLSMSAPLAELSTTTGSLIKAFPAGPYGLSMPTGLALAGQELWAADPFTNHLVAVRAATGALAQSLWGSPYRFDQPAAMAVSGDDLFVANEAGDCVTELNTSTGALARVIAGARFGFGAPASLAVAAPTSWWPTRGRPPNRTARSPSSTPPRARWCWCSPALTPWAPRGWWARAATSLSPTPPRAPGR